MGGNPLTPTFSPTTNPTESPSLNPTEWVPDCASESVHVSDVIAWYLSTPPLAPTGREDLYEKLYDKYGIEKYACANAANPENPLVNYFSGALGYQ
jgi:hypothetical protein